jgi:hypothetical protein
MGVLVERTDTECEILPNIEKEELDGTFRKSSRHSTSDVEKVAPYLDIAILESTAELNQQTNPAAAKVLEELGLRLVEDDYVKWRTDASAHPRNWMTARKTFDTGLVLLLDLFTWVQS